MPKRYTGRTRHRAAHRVATFHSRVQRRRSIRPRNWYDVYQSNAVHSAYSRSPMIGGKCPVKMEWQKGMWPSGRCHLGSHSRSEATFLLRPTRPPWQRDMPSQVRLLELRSAPESRRARPVRRYRAAVVVVVIGVPVSVTLTVVLVALPLTWVAVVAVTRVPRVSVAVHCHMPFLLERMQAPEAQCRRPEPGLGDAHPTRHRYAATQSATRGSLHSRERCANLCHLHRMRH